MFAFLLLWFGLYLICAGSIYLLTGSFPVAAVCGAALSWLLAVLVWLRRWFHVPTIR